ncbi:Protein of unknown function [Pyronema omphalodes CBS 100304]|uniref:Uncharacterized protein n=1 Tax=Pyronema omphalodes (strain CBS 100304) TaxID=1076935 RepID=U4LU13_PYROM|nr:Protein of unknown function [Pyronema omphalodes CBS 100304]
MSFRWILQMTRNLDICSTGNSVPRPRDEMIPAELWG